MSKRPPAWLGLGLKLIITTILLYYLLSKVSTGPALSRILTMRPAAALGAIGLVLMQVALGSVRWQWIIGLLGAPMALARAARYTLIGQFFNQVLPTAFGGDAARAWLASSDGTPMTVAVRSVLCDRIVGLVALLVIISATFLAMPRIAETSRPMFNVLRTTAILTAVLLAGLVLVGAPIARRLQGLRWARPIGTLVSDLLTALGSKAKSVGTLGASFAAHLSAVAAICLCARGMGIALDAGAALAVVPTIVLVAMAPISIAGWGVREGAMVIGLGLLGVSAADALAVSVSYGLVQVGVGVLGGTLWLATPRPRRP